MFAPLTATQDPETGQARKVGIICSKAGLDEVYPSLILANGARQAGIEAFIFFTFYGLDAITKDKVDHLHVNMAGNPASPVPTVIAGLPGMENLAASMMRRQLKELDLPDVHEMITTLHEAGTKLYACDLAMQMFGRKREQLLDEVDDVITVGDFYDVTAGAQLLFT
jgi:peroxiredoxin family protein